MSQRISTSACDLSAGAAAVFVVLCNPSGVAQAVKSLRRPSGPGAAKATSSTAQRQQRNSSSAAFPAFALSSCATDTRKVVESDAGATSAGGDAQLLLRCVHAHGLFRRPAHPRSAAAPNDVKAAAVRIEHAQHMQSQGEASPAAEKPPNSNTTTYKRFLSRAIPPLPAQRGRRQQQYLRAAIRAQRASNQRATSRARSTPSCSPLLTNSSCDLSNFLFNLQLVGPLMSIGAIWFLWDLHATTPPALRCAALPTRLTILSNRLRSPRANASSSTDSIMSLRNNASRDLVSKRISPFRTDDTASRNASLISLLTLRDPSSAHDERLWPRVAAVPTTSETEN